MKVSPTEIDGVPCFAPEFAYGDEDYPPEAFARLVELEANNFWFRSRNRLITGLFRRFLERPARAKVLEIGCGTGFVLSALHAERRFDLVGAELHIEGLRFAKQRLPDVEFVQLNARTLPYRGEFHAIGAFDVIEHIQEDEEVMASVHAALLPDGLFFITVPQHAWLWSAADDDAKHKRRYSRRELLDKLQRNGFTVRFCSSFVFTLLPLMYLSRRRRRAEATGNGGNYDELKLPKIVDKLLAALMKVDELLIAARRSLPAGGSLVVVAQRCAVAAS